MLFFLCSDTVGRSSMFCAIMSTIERCKIEGEVDVFQVIKALRVQKPGAILNVVLFSPTLTIVLLEVFFLIPIMFVPEHLWAIDIDDHFLV